MNDFVELRQYAAIVLKRWWIMLLGAIIGAALGYGISQRMSPVYQATAALIVGQSIQATSLDSRDIQTSELLALTYAEMAQHQPILQGAIDVLGLNVGWQRLRRQVQVQPIEGTQLLEVSAEAGSPEEAEVIANEIARQLILLSPTGAEDPEGNRTALFVRERLENLQNRIEGGQRRIIALDEAMQGATTTEEMIYLQDEINTLQELITDWENNYVRLLGYAKEEKPPSYLALFVGAQARRTPVRPMVQVNTLIAGVVGLFLSLVLIFTLEYLDDSIKSTDCFDLLLPKIC